jgi:hypothetical protein
MAITGSPKVQVQAWGGPGQVYGDFAKAEITAVLGAAIGSKNRRKKRETLADLRRASQLALLRRRKTEELEARVKAQIEQAVSAGATIEYDPQAMRIAKISAKIDQDLAIAFEAQRRAEEEQEQTRKRRKRDQIAVMLLLH